MNAPKETLRDAASARGMKIGVAATLEWIRCEPDYSATLARHFNLLTPENAMKSGPLRPGPGEFDFREADELSDFAREHGMALRGHTLVWHQQLPSWLPMESGERAVWQPVMEHHIHTVASHFHGRVECWDVVNEAVADDGELRRTPWLEALGPGYLARAFHLAHEADPGARLFYNDYGAEGRGMKSDAVYRLVRSLLDDGAPIHGVGLQMHVSEENHPAAEDLLWNIERLGRLGLEVQITEMDVRLRLPVSPDSLGCQAVITRDMIDACLMADNCTAVTLWGFTDRHSWIPGFFPGYGDALILDAVYEPKPAFFAILDALRHQSSSSGE